MCIRDSQISASTQLRVDSAATQATRIGSTYSVQGSNIQTAPTTSNNVTTYAAMGGLTKKTGDSTVATQTQAAYQQKNVGEAFSLTESFTLGDESISVSATTGVLIEDYAQTSATSTTSTTTATANDGTVTNTEFQHLNTVTGNVQTQIDAKADTSSLAASATTDTTNASNIGSGTLNKARLPASIDADTTGNAATATLATTATTPVNLPSTTLGAIGTYAFAYPFDTTAGTNVYAIAVGGTVAGDKLCLLYTSPSPRD